MSSLAPLRVTIDISPVQYARGVSRYTSNLVTALVARPDVDVTLFGRSLRQYDVLRQWSGEFGSRVKKRLWRVPPQIFDTAWELLRFPPLTMIAPQTEVYHAWEWQLAPVSSLPQVVTIHDLAHVLYPETAHPLVVQKFNRLLTTLERQKDWPIIAVSEATKRDIRNLTSIAEDRIFVVPEALPVESKVIPAQVEQEATLKKYNLKKPYFLIVGTAEPRKNMQRMIAAWQPLSHEYDLVIAGAAGWENLARQRGLHVLGFVSPLELASLYRRAQALIYASLYEGFGLPLLEAFFHECPVVTSRVSSMPEVAGEAAQFVDPYDVPGMTAALQSIPQPDSPERTQLLLRMQEQLSQFSWERAAEETVRVYRLAKERA